jgi:hypothetical protein
MKRALIFFVLILAAAAVYWFVIRSKPGGPKAPKTPPMALKKHSESFNNSINNVITEYLAVKDAFIEADTSTAKAKTNALITALNALDTAELKKDTAMVFETVMASLADVKSNAESLLKQTDITEMRRDFSSLTDMLYPTFFKAISYEGPKLYLINCPMAFNDEIPANWISNSEKVINPYLGKNHPKHGAGMLNCGEVKDTIKAQ